MLIVALFYVVGNYQNFTDRTQFQLLTIMQSVGSIAAVGSAIAFILELMLFFYHRNVKTIVHVLLLVIGMVVSFSITVGSSGLLVFLGAV